MRGATGNQLVIGHLKVSCASNNSFFLGPRGTVGAKGDKGVGEMGDVGPPGAPGDV